MRTSKHATVFILQFSHWVILRVLGADYVPYIFNLFYALLVQNGNSLLVLFIQTMGGFTFGEAIKTLDFQCYSNLNFAQNLSF